MKFTVIATSSTGRCGLLTTARGSRLETPRAALLTRAGAVPHVTRAVLERALPEPQLLVAPLSSCLHLEEGARAAGGGLAAFCGARTQDAWLMLPEDLSVGTQDGHFEGDSVPLWTRHGKALIDPKRYMSITGTLSTDAVCVLADMRSHVGSHTKRRQRAVQRTTRALTACLDKRSSSHEMLLGVVTGWGSDHSVKECTDAVLGAGPAVGGVVLAGLREAGRGWEAGPEVIPPQLADVLRTLGNRLIVAPGRWSPSAVVSLVSSGVDVVDTSEPLTLAEEGFAVVFAITKEEEERPVILDLNDEKYKCDFTPLVPGCQCVCCMRHTRSYIHHLIQTKELLAPLLLTLHNLHHYSLLMSEIRVSPEGVLSRLTAQHPRWLREHPVHAADRVESEKEPRRQESLRNNKRRKNES